MKRFLKRFVTVFLAMLLAMSVIVPMSASAAGATLAYILSYEGKYVYLTIEPKDSADTIYYTTNGKTPTQKSKVYTDRIKSSAKVNINAVEIDKNGKQVATLKVTMKPRVQRPEIALYTENGKKYVKITCKEKGAKIYYTTDGSEPTTKSARYKEKIPYTEGTEVRARAYKNGMTKSAVTSFCATFAPVNVPDEVEKVFELTNKERKTNGSSELLLDAALCEAAEIRAKELATLYSHTRPDGTKGMTVIDELGIKWTGRSENIARKQTTPAEAVADWMASPSHRATLLSNDFNYIGIGHYYANGIDYWVQLFIRK